MSISPSDIAAAKTRYPSLTPIYGTDGQIDKAQVQMVGIAGGRNTTQVVYQTILTFDGFPVSPPTAWIAYPQEAQIRHMNIFHPSGSLNLPHVCMGNYGSVWTSLAPNQRTLLHFLLALTHVLQLENPSSPARH